MSTATFAIRFSIDTSIMANPTVRAAHINDSRTHGTRILYADITNGTLPAVSFVKPSGFVDGHPASSKLDLFEGFTQEDRGRGAELGLCGTTPRSSSRSTKAAAITTPVTFSRWTSSATARAFR